MNARSSDEAGGFSLHQQQRPPTTTTITTTTTPSYNNNNNNNALLQQQQQQQRPPTTTTTTTKRRGGVGAKTPNKLNPGMMQRTYKSCTARTSQEFALAEHAIDVKGVTLSRGTALAHVGAPASTNSMAKGRGP